jgi:hypothetical protein
MGGLWVGGRVTLTQTDIAFVPNRSASQFGDGT